MPNRIGSKQIPEQSKLESNGREQRLEGSQVQRYGSMTQIGLALEEVPNEANQFELVPQRSESVQARNR